MEQDLVFQKKEAVYNSFIYIQEFNFRFGLTAEFKEALYDFFAPACFCNDFFQVFSLSIVFLFKFFQQEACVNKNSAQRIIDLMGNTSGQTSK